MSIKQLATIKTSKGELTFDADWQLTVTQDNDSVTKRITIEPESDFIPLLEQHERLQRAARVVVEQLQRGTVNEAALMALEEAAYD